MGKGGFGFKLPRLTAAVDCGPIGYPGLLVHFWLNVTVDTERESDTERAERAARLARETGERIPDRPAWENDYHYALGRIVDRVEIPGAYNESGEDTEIEVGDGESLYSLMLLPGFEQQIILWAAGQYYRLRAERLAAEVKN